MSVLEWRYYMPPNIQESSDGQWRIYQSRQYGRKPPTYSLLRVGSDGIMRCVYYADSADKCEVKADEMNGGHKCR